MTPLDFWLQQAERYVAMRRPHMAVRSLRIAANCQPSLKVRLAIAIALHSLGA